MVARCGLKGNSYPSNRISIRTEKNHYRFFFLHTLPSTIVVKLEYALFYHFYAKVSIFSIKKCSVRHPSKNAIFICLGEKKVFLGYKMG